MPEEPENKDEWRPLSNPRFAQGALWVTLGLGGWIILMIFAVELAGGPDRDSAWLAFVIFVPIVVTFVVAAFGLTLAIPKRYPVARSTVSLLFLLIALFWAVMYTWTILCCL